MLQLFQVGHEGNLIDLVRWTKIDPTYPRTIIIYYNHLKYYYYSNDQLKTIRLDMPR
jgi:hypothetical protein